MEGTISEIRLFAGNFEPSAWSFCNGQSLSIATNTALFALIGTTYGGDGIENFSLPDFRGRVAVGVGNGPGLPAFQLGEVIGSESITLTTGNLATHIHTVSGAGSIPVNGTFSATMNVSTSSDGSSPSGQYIGADGSGSGTDAATSTTGDTLNSNAITVNTSGLSVNVGAMQIGVTGKSSPVNNMMPYLALNYIIALEGIFPSRN